MITKYSCSHSSEFSFFGISWRKQGCSRLPVIALCQSSVWFNSSRMLLEIRLVLGFATLLLYLLRYLSPALHSRLQTGCSWSSFPAGWTLLLVRNPALTSSYELGILHAPSGGCKRGRLCAALSWRTAFVLAHSSAFQQYISLLHPELALRVLL